MVNNGDIKSIDAEMKENKNVHKRPVIKCLICGYYYNQICYWKFSYYSSNTLDALLLADNF